MSLLPTLSREELITLFSAYMNFVHESSLVGLPFNPSKEAQEEFKEAIAKFIIASREEEK